MYGELAEERYCNKMTFAKILPLIGFIAVTAAAAAFGSTFQPGEWYEQLAKPDWTPPNWLFGPVWSVLYLMIAVSGWFAWKAQGFGVLVAIWVLQLLLNAAWSWIMFGQHQIGIALIDIILLVSVSLLYVTLAWSKSGTAAFLFLPYCVWIAYATALNFALWILNA